MINKTIIRSNVRILIIILLISFIAISNLNCDEKPKEYKFTYIPSQTEMLNIPESDKVTSIYNQDPQIITDIVSCNDMLNRHFPTEINCSFKEALTKESIKKRFIRKQWKIQENKISIPAKNHKLVFQNVRGNSYVFKVSSKRSLLTLISKLDKQADQFYKYPTAQTSYFLVQYKNREIPTYLPDLTLELLSEWESTWIKENHVTQEYFDKHIFVQNVKFSFWDKIDIEEPYSFIVDYFFEVDWVKAKLKDFFVLPMFEHPRLKSKQTRITIIDSIDSVISMSDVVDKVTAISDTVYMNLNIGDLYYKKIKSQDFFKLSQEGRTKIKYQKLKGRLVINFQGKFDFESNQRFIGRIYLDTGELEYYEITPRVIE